MKTLTKNKKLALAVVAVLIVTILAVSIGLIANAVEQSRKVLADTENGQLLSGKVYDMPKQLTLTDMAADEGVNLKVKLKPSFVANAKINFVLRWQDSAVTDDINTFLTLTTVSDTQCNLKIVQRFNNKLDLVATAELDSSITKTCQVDCYSYLESVNTTFELHSGKGVVTDTGKITANSTDKIFGKGQSDASCGWLHVLSDFNFDYYNDTYIVVKGDYSFGLGTKLFFKGLSSSLKISSDSGLEFNSSSDIFFDSYLDFTTKTGNFEFETEHFNLNYFFDKNIFKDWWHNYCDNYPDINEPIYNSSLEFYKDNIHKLIDDFLSISYTFKAQRAVGDYTNGIVTCILAKKPNYLYDMSFDDSVALK